MFLWGFDFVVSIWFVLLIMMVWLLLIVFGVVLIECLSVLRFVIVVEGISCLVWSVWVFRLKNIFGKLMVVCIFIL